MMAAAAIKEPVGMVKSSRSQSQLDERNKENTFSSEFLDDTNTSARKNKDTTLISALHNKYSTSSMKSMHCQIFLASNAPGKTASGNFRVPENLTLDMCQITSAGLRDDVARLCSGVRELDLAQNRIESWEEVWNILDLIPKLEFLNLTKNPLRQLTASCGCRKYERLRKLVLNFTNLTWETIENLLAVLPNLEELYLSGNSYDKIDLNMPAYESLRLLQLTENKFEDWSCILKIDKVFPKLCTLILAHNKISTCGSVENNEGAFRHLQVLNMNNTFISEWDELGKLSVIKSVADIRLHSIPLVQNYDELKRRQLVVVYFPHVSRLNGSVISDSERDTAERVYLRHFQNIPDKPLWYNKLVGKHGNIDPLANVNLQPASTVSMTVICGVREELFDIPTKQTIGQLKTSLRKFVGSKKFRLYHDDKCQGPTEIRTNNRFVWALNFRDGETLICDHIEPASPCQSPGSSPVKCQSYMPPRKSSYQSQRSPRKDSDSSDSSSPPTPTKEPPLKKR